MGSRANYVIVGNGGVELFYSHAGATTLLDDLARGPEVVGRFRAERAVREWLDDVWCEGAALVDLANEVLLHFTWHHDGVADRARKLAAIEDAWVGWDVRWAYGGIEDVVAHLGLDRLTVRTGRAEVEALNGPHEDFPHETTCVLTVRDADGVLRGYAVHHEFCEPLWAGPRLLHLVEPLTPVAGRGVLSPDDQGPDLGVHVDVARREVGCWTATTVKGSVEELAAAWPGWRFEFWEDRHEEQARRCAGEFEVFPFPPRG
ncbi:hypothetical protein ACQPYE_03795 [Actinosynnema sp. CA-299493]